MIDNPWEYFKHNNFKALKVALHPDKHGGTPEACKRFSDLITAWEISQTPQKIICEEKVLREIETGDLRQVFRINDGVVKQLLVNNKATKNLLKKEKEYVDVLSSGQYQPYFPSISITYDGSVERYPERLFSLDKVMKNYPNGLCGRNMGWITRRFLVGLGYTHKQNICHCAVYPEHMLISEGHAGILTGWIHAEKINNPIKVVSRQRKDWYTTKVATPAQDIKLLGKSLLEVSGDIPQTMRNFFKALQLRTPDCWTLEEEFADLLKREYGEPKFQYINVTGLK